MALKDIRQVVSERRQFPRVETLNPANIAGADMKTAMVCVVLDWSRGGAPAFTPMIPMAALTTSRSLPKTAGGWHAKLFGDVMSRLALNS